MALIQIRKNPSRRELAWFGAMLAAFLAVVGLIARFRFDAPRVAWGLWAGAVLVAALYYAVPAARRRIYLGWVYLTFPIGWIVSHALLATVYYFVLTPIGLGLRALGRLSIRRGFDPSLPTYWVAHRPSDSPAERYFQQY
jgi:hypothetical protein